MNAPSRRTIVRGAAWSVPVIAVAAHAPVFAASALTCKPTGCKLPGKGHHTKDYVLTPACDQVVTAVWIDYVAATRLPNGDWIVKGRKDSRRNRHVRIITTAGEWSGSVAFPPCKDKP